MGLDIGLDSEDKQPKRGPCPFFGIEEGSFSCEIRVKVCNHDDNVSSRCTKYRILGNRLMHEVRARCVVCQRVEFENEWLKPEEIIIPNSNNPIPLDIWEKFGDLPNVFCLDPKCRPKKEGE